MSIRELITHCSRVARGVMRTSLCEPSTLSGYEYPVWWTIRI
jgi:hypothetical protein